MKGALRIWAGRVAIFALVSKALVFAIGRPVQPVAPAAAVRAQPPIGATVKTPLQIDLWFNQPLRNASNAVVVLPASALPLPASAWVDLARGGPVLDPKDGTHLWAILQPLPPGLYAVQWQVLPQNGQVASGQYTFRVVE